MISAIQILKMYEVWEADLLSSDENIFLDYLPDGLYDRLLEIQVLRTEALKRIFYHNSTISFGPAEGVNSGDKIDYIDSEQISLSGIMKI